MADGTVNVLQDSDGDRLIDNEVVTNGLSQTVYRQKVNLGTDEVGIAKEATLATLLTEATFTAEDFATQTTLEAARVLLSTIDADTSTLAAVDFATETTLATLLTESTFAAEDFATQTTLEAARVLLNSLDGKDFATQTTLAAILTELQAKADLAETQPVSGPLTDAELRATPVPVSGTLTADFEGDSSDLDSDAGTDNHETVAIGLPGAGGHVVGGTATNPIRTDTTGTTTQPVSAASLPLPSGAATSANQQTDALTDAELRATDVKVTLDSETVTIANPTADPETGLAKDTSLTSILTELQGKADLAETQPVSAASLPLPTGAATAANQQTDALTDAELRATAVPVSGTVAISNPTADPETGLAKDSTLVTIDGVLDNIDADLGAAADAEATGNGSVIAILKRLRTILGTIDTDTGTLAGVDYATQTTLASVLTAVDGIEALLATIDTDTGNIAGKDFATQTTLAALLTELQAKADLAETQPVSAASLPLPSGAATQTTLAALLAELQLKADPTESQAVTGKRESTSFTPSSVAGTYGTASTTTVITPGAGNSIRVWWVYAASDPDSTNNPLITVKFSGGTVLYKGYMFSHWQMFEGPTDETVQITLDSADTMAYTIHYEEV